MYMDGHGWGMGGGGLLMLLFWGLVIGGIAALIVVIARRTGNAGKESGSALDILKRRYAKGEITREEYESMKKDIGDQ